MKDVITQGSVWSSLKYTTSKDKLNKTAMSDRNISDHYKEDSNIPFGELGFADDTLGLSKCGKEQ